MDIKDLKCCGNCLEYWEDCRSVFPPDFDLVCNDWKWDKKKEVDRMMKDPEIMSTTITVSPELVL